MKKLILSFLFFVIYLSANAQRGIKYDQLAPSVTDSICNNCQSCNEVEMFDIQSPGGLTITNPTDINQVYDWITDHQDNTDCNSETLYSYKSFCRVRDQIISLEISDEPYTSSVLNIGPAQVVFSESDLIGSYDEYVNGSGNSVFSTSIENQINLLISAMGLSVNNVQITNESPYSIRLFLNSDGLQDISGLSISGIDNVDNTVLSCNTEGDYFVWESQSDEDHTLIESPQTTIDVSPCLDPKGDPLLYSTTLQGAMCEIASLLQDIVLQDNGDGSFTFTNPSANIEIVTVQMLGSHLTFKQASACPSVIPTIPELLSGNPITEDFTYTDIGRGFALGTSVDVIYDGCTLHYTYDGTSWVVVNEDTDSTDNCGPIQISSISAVDPSDYLAVEDLINTYSGLNDCGNGTLYYECESVIENEPITFLNASVFAIDPSIVLPIPIDYDFTDSGGNVIGTFTVNSNGGGGAYAILGAGLTTAMTGINIESIDETNCWVYEYHDDKIIVTNDIESPITGGGADGNDIDYIGNIQTDEVNDEIQITGLNNAFTGDLDLSWLDEDLVEGTGIDIVRVGETYTISVEPGGTVDTDEQDLSVGVGGSNSAELQIDNGDNVFIEGVDGIIVTEDTGTGIITIGSSGTGVDINGNFDDANEDGKWTVDFGQDKDVEHSLDGFDYLIFDSNANYNFRPDGGTLGNFDGFNAGQYDFGAFNHEMRTTFGAKTASFETSNGTYVRMGVRDGLTDDVSFFASKTTSVAGSALVGVRTRDVDDGVAVVGSVLTLQNTNGEAEWNNTVHLIPVVEFLAEQEINDRNGLVPYLVHSYQESLGYEIISAEVCIEGGTGSTNVEILHDNALVFGGPQTVNAASCIQLTGGSTAVVTNKLVRIRTSGTTQSPTGLYYNILMQ